VSSGAAVGAIVGAGASGFARSRTVSTKLEISLSEALSRLWLVWLSVLWVCVVGKAYLNRGQTMKDGLRNLFGGWF
jgi:hypothetical protein